MSNQREAALFPPKDDRNVHILVKIAIPSELGVKNGLGKE